MSIHLYFADGVVTGHLLMCAPSLRTLVASFIPDADGVPYLDASHERRVAMRRSAAVSAARRAQDRAVTAAIRSGSWTPAGVTDAEIARINNSRVWPDTGGAWDESGMKLFLVHGGSGWQTPAGSTVVGWASDLELLMGLRECGEISYTRLLADPIW